MNRTVHETSRRVILACLLVTVCGGCISMPKQLPAEYFQPKRTMMIRVTECVPTPSLHTDQPTGKVAGATYLARQKAMQNRMAGITPDMIKQAVEKALAEQLKDTFTVSVDEAQLVLEVVINDWGWSVPTGKYGESTDIHCFRIGGRASIFDPARNRERVYFTYNGTDTPLGDHLTAEKCLAALPGAAEDFAAQIARFIQQGRPK